MSTTTARHDEALRLRNQDFTYSQIASRLGYGTPQGARHAVMTAARRAAAAALPTERLFGIEIEFNGCSQQDALIAVQAAGIDCRIEPFNHTTRTWWKLITDVTAGWEIVSPPLSGEDGYEQVRKVMEALSTAGAQVDRRCGMHVHHDAADLSGEDIASMVEFYAGHQDAINRLVAPSRRTMQRYLGPLSSNEVRLIANQMRANRTAANVTRYRNINATDAFTRHGTIEIRQHQGSLNPEKAIAWIKFGQSMIRAAKATAVQSVPNTVFEMLQTLTTDHGLAAEAAEYLMGRAMHFTPQQ